jgi:hypothetical protein
MKVKKEQKGSDKKEQKKEKKEQASVVAENEYNGKKMFTIARPEDVEDGVFTGKFPLFSCGMSKAEFILRHIDDLKDYVTANKKAKK